MLETEVTELLDVKTQTVFNQKENETANAFGKVEHFYQENKDVYEKLLQSKDEQIALLKSLLDREMK